MIKVNPKIGIEAKSGIFRGTYSNNTEIIKRLL